jgi:hypothetical protein
MIVVPLKCSLVASGLPDLSDCKQKAWREELWPRETKLVHFGQLAAGK